MGVNVSKTENRPVIRSKLGDNTLLVQSCETFSLDEIDDHASNCSTSLSSVDGDDTCRKTSEVVAIGNVKITDTQQKHIDGKPSVAIAPQSRTMPSKKTDANVHSTSNLKNGMCNQPVSDAEKRLHLYNEELKSKDVLENKLPKPNPPTKTHILMKNDDILKVRRTGVFAPDMLPDATPKTLTPISSKKPGQTDILYNLGKEGIVKPMSVEQKTLGELRTIGIIKQNDDPGGHSDSPSSNKRVNPRLTPLKVENMWSKVPEAELTAPWEKIDLFQESCTSISQNHQVKTEDGALEEQTSESSKLKIKMMDVDLL